MKYIINSKNIKQSIGKLSHYLKEKNFNIPHNVMLEAFAKALFLRNWNTLQSIMNKTDSIKEIECQYQYILEITIDMNKPALLKILEQSFIKANAKLNIDKFSLLNEDNIKDNILHHQIIFNMQGNGENFLTALFILCEQLKSIKVPENIEYCRIKVEKESLLEYFNQKKKLSDEELCDKQEKLSMLTNWKDSQKEFTEKTKKIKN